MVGFEMLSRCMLYFIFMIIRKIALLALFIGLILATGGLAEGTVSLSSSVTSKIKASSDYAADVFADPWDMNNTEDIWSVKSNITNPTFANGIFSATTTSTDPRLHFLWGGYPNSIAGPRDGVANPIDAAKYKYMGLRMYSSVDGIAQIYWFYNQDTTIDSKFRQFKVKAGWHVYTLAPHSSWVGQPIGLRIDPVNVSGANIAIDWFQLGAATTGSSIDLNWTTDGFTPTSYDFFVSSDSADFEEKGNIGQASAPSLSASVSLASLANGNYYIYVKKKGSGSSENSNVITFAVNQTPTVNIMDPDLAGGKDWATLYLGDSWDMSNSKDIAGFHSLAGKGFRNGYFTAYNAGSIKDDPYILLNQRGKRIDAAKYHRLTVIYRFDGSFDLVRGTMARVGWKNYPRNRGWQHTDDLLTYEGWNTLTYDLTGANLDIGNYGWRDYITNLRFDPHEDPQTRRFYIDEVRLAADDVAENGSFNIKYRLSDADDSNLTLSLKADSDKVLNNGNESLIASYAAATGDGSYNWVPGTSINGSYNILAELNDGVNSSYSYSSGPVVVDNYAPRTYAKKAVVKRVRQKAKAARYLKLYRANKAKIGKARKPANKKRFIKLARKYNKAYINAKRGIAKAYFRWHVKDPYSQNEANVTLVIQKRVQSKAKVKKKAYYLKKYRAYKSLYKKVRAASNRKRYLKAAKRYYIAYRKTSKFVYKTTKIVKYGNTEINKWRSYVIKSSNANTYRFLVYATDPAGNNQFSVAKNFLIIK